MDVYHSIRPEKVVGWMWLADKLGLRNWINRRDGFVAGGLLSPAALPVAFATNDQRVRMMRQAIQSSTRPSDPHCSQRLPAEESISTRRGAQLAANSINSSKR
jgi:hypothetical protein